MEVGAGVTDLGEPAIVAAGAEDGSDRTGTVVDTDILLGLATNVDIRKAHKWGNRDFEL